MLLEKAFILDGEQFEDLRNHLNAVGKSLDGVVDIFEKIRKYVETEGKRKISLSNEEYEELNDFFDSLVGYHHKLLEDIWTDDDDEDEKRYFPKCGCG